ncbi:MAG: alkane 1-monooxygenase [Pseudomonadota bacterium]
MTPAKDVARLRNALPFWMSLGTLPLAAIGATVGGWTVLLLPMFTWVLFDLLDLVVGLNEENADPATAEADLFWYRLITLVWAPLQLAMIFGTIWYVTHRAHLSAVELVLLFAGIGIVSGAVGIVYAHELMHQKNAGERWLGDLLMASVLYSHFRTEHLRVHHLYVGTPRDAVTARYGEGFHRFFLRVLRSGLPSAWRAERALLARRDRPVWHRSNPFWRYGALQLAMLVAALALGGGLGLALFVWQALVAVWQLELVNYIEHYGLTRRHLGEGRYEHVLPRHSWNSAHKASNWFLINLQRHSDHHYKPDRRFPLLQTYPETEAPQLPWGYPLMGIVALIPPLWRRVMNPRVQAWRARHYPDITDWSDYNRGATPLPRNAS